MKKSWIRSLCMVLCIAFMFTFMEGVALADESGEWGNLTWKLDSKGTLTISGTGEMEELFFSDFDDRAWHNITGQIRKVVIKQGVTSIGAYAFESCESLISVSIPASVTSIGDYAFAGCKALPEIIIPNSVISIGVQAFSSCESLKSIIIPDSVITIDESAFKNCLSLKTISIPNSVNSIDRAFAGCEKLAEIKISMDHPYFEIIDGSLFTKTDKQLIRYLPTLKENSYTIPDGTTGIGNDAFSGHKMTSITIPDSVSSIGNTAFVGLECDSFNISPNHPYFEIADGSLIGKADKVLYKYVGRSIPSNYTIPDGVTSINAYAFKSIDGMKTITIPDSVTSIGEYAFSDSDLQSITIPDSVTSIGEGAFQLCESLQSITIPDSVTSIGEGAFEYSDLKSIKLSKNITSIPTALFAGSSVESVDIPDGVTSIGELAFSLCTHLQSITIPDSVTSIGGMAFVFCTDLQSVTISDRVTSIGHDAFSCCLKLQSITIPDSVTSIEGNPFGKCFKLTNIEISPDHPYLELIDNALFTKTDKRLICYTYALRTKEYVIPDGTTGIEEAAFSGQKELGSVVIPASVTSIGKNAFSECDKLTATVIKGSYAQQYCKENGIKTKEIRVSKVILDPAELFFYVGTNEVKTVKASLEPVSVPPVGLTWTPAKKDIVEITETEDGTVSIKPLKSGKTDITVKEPGGKSAKLKVNVVDPVESVELAVKGNAKAGGKVNITATLAPKTAGNKTVEYSLDVGEDIATINNKGQLSISKNAPSGTKITVTCTALGALVPVTASVVVEVP